MIKQLVAAAALTGTLTLPTASVSADPPGEQVATDLFLAIPDFDVDKGVLVNIKLQDLCDWAEAGSPGPPPVIADVDIGVVASGQQAVVAKADTDLYIEIWNFDDDPDLTTPCTAFADQLANGDHPLATGTARYTRKSNDALESGTRAAAIGERVTGVLTGQDGTEYHYRNVFRRNDQCRVVDFGDPNCLVENSSLRTR